MTDEANLMEPESTPQPVILFPRTIAVAVSQLKRRLQEDYEEAYPGLSEIVRLVLDEEEARAWELTSFPHLVLPDMVEAHVATLGLEPATVRGDSHLARAMTRQLTLAAAS